MLAGYEPAPQLLLLTPESSPPSTPAALSTIHRLDCASAWRSVHPVPVDVDEASISAAVRAAHLFENLGYHVEDAVVPALSEHTRQAFDDVWAVLAAEGVRGGEALLGRPVTSADMEPLTWALYEQAQTLDALSYRTAFAGIQRAAREIVTAALRYDVLLTPALAEPPVPIGTITGWPEPDPLQALARSDRFSPYTSVWNMTGQPALTLPLDQDGDGLPVGIQLVGPPAGDAVLLAMAAHLEQAHPRAAQNTIPAAGVRRSPLTRNALSAQRTPLYGAAIAPYGAAIAARTRSIASSAPIPRSRAMAA